jgi:hypothetical protein
VDEEQKKYLDEKFTEVRAEIGKTETKLLRAFHWWARPKEIQIRLCVSDASGFEERAMPLCPRQPGPSPFLLSLLPAAGALADSGFAIKEWLGIAACRLRGWAI